jgi:hypothetical protein
LPLLEAGDSIVSVKRGKVFLSYARSDQKLAHRLAHDITKAGFEVWYDREQLLPGDDWGRAVSNALQSADAMVVVMSPEAAETPSVQREVEYAVGSERYAGKLIPVVVGSSSKMPWILNKLQPVRVSRDVGAASEQVIAALEKSSSDP